MKELRNLIHNILINNRRKSGDHQFTVPSPESYPYQWFWDSCFHAIILSHFDTEDAKKELRSLVSKQFKNGLLPHIIYWEEKAEVLNIDWGVKGNSTLAQPPIIAYATWQIYEKDGDINFLKEIYPKLARYYRHLLTRDPRQHHLIGIINPDESGEDNSPRFDIPLELPPKHSVEENNQKRFELFKQNKECDFDAAKCMRNFFWVKDVPFNSYLVENLVILAKISHILNFEGDEVYFAGQAALVKEAMREFMFEDGIFWTINGKNHDKIKVKTWALFAPLIGNIFTEEEAKAVVEKHLTNNKEFWSTYPVPTVSMDEESYSPEEPSWGKAWEHPNWRGPVWIGSNWFLYRGLKKYGFLKEAEHIRKKSFELVEKEGCREYYHPETGEGMGAQSFTWGGLILDMD